MKAGFLVGKQTYEVRDIPAPQTPDDGLVLAVVVPRVTDAACWGAALLAGHAAGCFEDLAAAASAAVHLEKRYEPDPARADQYRERYDLYCEVYPTLKELLHRL